MGSLSAANPIGERDWTRYQGSGIEVRGMIRENSDAASRAADLQDGDTIEKLCGRFRSQWGNKNARQKTALGNGAELTYQQCR
jgi:hypothetical protein